MVIQQHSYTGFHICARQKVGQESLKRHAFAPVLPDSLYKFNWLFLRAQVAERPYHGRLLAVQCSQAVVLIASIALRSTARPRNIKLWLVVSQAI